MAKLIFTPTGMMREGIVPMCMSDQEIWRACFSWIYGLSIDHIDILKQTAWEFVSLSYGCSREHFDLVWNVVEQADFSGGHSGSNLISYGRLAVIGDDEGEDETVLPILIFAEGSKIVADDMDAKEILAL